MNITFVNGNFIYNFIIIRVYYGSIDSKAQISRIQYSRGRNKRGITYVSKNKGYLNREKKKKKNSMDPGIQEKNNKSTKHKSHDRSLQRSSRPVVSNQVSMFRSSCHDSLKPFFKFSSSVVPYSIGNLLRLFLSCSLATFIRPLWNVSVDRFRRGYALSGVGAKEMLEPGKKVK